MRARTIPYVLLSVAAIVLRGVGAPIASAQEVLYFSTEEDFLSQGPTPPDGNPIVSDGDLLSIPKYPDLSVVEIYLRNHELLQQFDVREDLGLDAADVIEPRKRMVVFSTELDDPHNRFSDGDLLATDGTMLPNAALLSRFDLPTQLDLGLDALQLVGEPEAILRLLKAIRERGREFWIENPKELPNLLKELGVDILFSTEGTPPTPARPRFLDGDLLSARDGTIVVSNAAFLPALPAGLPQRGMDYGCDAFAVALDPIEQMSIELFSTEVDSLARRLPFTDGDVLARGNGVVLKNGALIHPLEPVVKEVGLDALDFTGSTDPVSSMRITSIWWVKTVDLSAAGYAPNDLPGDSTGLGVKDRPFGGWLKIHGNLPGSGSLTLTDYEYRIEFLDAASTWQGIRTPDHFTADPDYDWEVEAAVPPGTSFVYASDTDGWIELADFWRTDDQKTLVVWDSGERGNGPSALRIALKEKATAAITYSPQVPVYLDNQAPRDNAARPDIVLTDGWTSQCDIPASARTITITGEVRDDHFYRFALVWFQSGLPANPIVTSYHDQGLPYLDGTGTLPMGSYPTLGTVTIPVGVDCGYIRIVAYDRTIVGEFRAKPAGIIDQLTTEPDHWQSRDRESFCFRSEPPVKP